MTNLLLMPLQRSFELSRRAATSAVRLSEALVAPVAHMTSTARATVRLAPTLAIGAYEQLGERIPRSLAQQLPARTAEVDALEARVARLEHVEAASRDARPAATHAATPRTAKPRDAKAGVAPSRAAASRTAKPRAAR